MVKTAALHAAGVCTVFGVSPDHGSSTWSLELGCWESSDKGAGGFGALKAMARGCVAWGYPRLVDNGGVVLVMVSGI